MIEQESGSAYQDAFTPEAAKLKDEQRARRFWSMFAAARGHEAPNRLTMRRDENAYHNQQWETEIKAAIEAEGRPALTINIIKPTIDLVLGDERVNRMNPVATPRGQADIDGADAGTQVLKYLKDQCDADMEISEWFSDGVRAGVGWLEVDIRRREDLRNDIANGLEYEPFVQHERWEFVWVDPNSRRNDISDARFVGRAMWLDVDEACKMHKKHAKTIREMVENPDQYLRDWAPGIEDDSIEPDPYEDVLDWAGDPVAFVDTARRQVLIIEIQYRDIEVVTLCKLPDGSMVEFDKANPMHVKLLDATPDQYLDDMFPEVERKVIKIAHLCGPKILQDERMPHKHGQFTLVPFYAYRDAKGRPYGLIRQLYDSQIDYNKRRSTALFLMTAKRVLVESTAVKSLAQLARQANMPNALITLEDGALRDGRIKFERDADLASGHIETMGIAKQEVEQVSGVNQEMKGQGPGDQSGRAIMARQAQGNLMLAPLKDNFRQALKRVFSMVLSLAQQYMTGEKELRITEAPTGKEWLKINGPDGVDLSQTRMDMTIEEAPATASVRQQNLQLLQDFLGQLPPEIRMALLPELIDGYDIPGKERIKARAEEMLGKMGFLGGAQAGPPGMPPGAPGAPPMAGAPQPPGAAPMQQAGPPGGPMAQTPVPAMPPGAA